MRYHKEQYRLFHDPRSIRFRIVSAGRRSGKTEVAKRSLALEAMENENHRYAICAPIRPQAKAIYWNDMLALLKGCYLPSGVSKTDLSITLINGTFIQLFGLGGSGANSDAASRLEGTPWHGVLIDEYAKCPPDVFKTNIRPMLAEFKGWCWFVGKPTGRNHYYEYYLRGLSNDFPEWDSYTWFSSDILDPEEVEAARREMDERTFRQEFEGSFESYEGLLYYNWDNKYVKPLVEEPLLPLWITSDFNKSPMNWNIAQIPYVGNIQHCRMIDQIDIGFNAKTPQAIEMFIKRYSHRQYKVVYITGDMSGSHESHRDWTTDYAIMGTALENAGWEVIWKVPKQNPGINNRVNVGCSIIAHDRLLVDPKCTRLIYDFERNESDGKGAKDKSDLLQTHASDNFDYLMWAAFGNQFFGAKATQH